MPTNILKYLPNGIALKGPEKFFKKNSEYFEILAKEHKAYPEAVRLIAERKINVVGRKVKIIP